MQMVSKAILFLFVILLSLAIFAPKRELYHLLEEQLMQNDIIINNEKIESGFFTLKLQHPELYIKGIRMAEIEEISFFTLFFYTSITARGIEADASLRKLIPVEIAAISVYYHLFSPESITLNTIGSFGAAKGYLLPAENLLHLDLVEEDPAKELKPFLKKGETGWYYETSF